MAKPRIQTVEGDITQISADALMTAINSGGLWFGGIDGAIQRDAGDLYHRQVAQQTQLRDLQTVVAKGSGNHRGKFKDVIFVIDDLQSLLARVVYAGLEAASNEEYTSLLIPTIRMGVMAGVRETPEQAIRGMADGLSEFVGAYSGKTNLRDIKVVVYKNPALAEDISCALVRI